MIITCPKCPKRYLVDDNSVPVAGRMLHCIACHHQWFYVKQQTAIPDINSAHTDLIGIQSSFKSQRSSSRFINFTLIGLIVALVLGLHFGKSYIVSKFPNLKYIYKTLGYSIDIATAHIEICNIQPLIEKIGSTERLIISGEFVNKTNTILTTFPLHIKIKGDCQDAPWLKRIWHQYITKRINQCVIAEWDYHPMEKKLFPGEILSFESRAPKPIKNPKSIQVKF